MNTLVATVFVAFLVVCTGQLGVTQSPSGSGMPNLGSLGSGMSSLGSAGSATSPLSTGQGPLNAVNPNPISMGGLLSNIPLPGANTPTTNTGNGVGGMFSNPLMTYGLMGGDNLKRAFMLPLLSRFGGSNTANYYYLRGGMDKYFKVMMTDMISNMLARSTGMNPMMTALMAGQMFDAPDNYALSNMILNRMNGGNRRPMGGTSNAMNSMTRMANAMNAMRGMRSNNAGSNPGEGVGLLPTGAASPFQQQPAGSSNMLSNMNPLALASMSLM